jgi:hypothetical protein
MNCAANKKIPWLPGGGQGIFLFGYSAFAFGGSA